MGCLLESAALQGGKCTRSRDTNSVWLLWGERLDMAKEYHISVLMQMVRLRKYRMDDVVSAVC